MADFLQQLYSRNATLYYFGLVCFILALLFILLSRTSNVQVYNVSAWYKPFKFALSIGLYAWTMAWYCDYLPNFDIKLFNWTTIVLLGFEIIYIAIQANRGQLSHFNVSSPMYSVLYMCMASAASIVTIYTAYIGLLFFTQSFPSLSNHYLWAIRLGIIIFVVFSFEGFVMGSKMTHTIGGPDGGPGIAMLNWSTKYGDPRIAHFIGMHALQVLPIMAYYFLKNTKMTFALAGLYALLAIYTLMLALAGRPLFKG